ncbi:formylglycine-generating enzyme family protein [Rhodobacteraceae bacterium]|nr:formylglycine-generating enzyme family protein [Paracoccaceae bacterium]
MDGQACCTPAAARARGFAPELANTGTGPTSLPPLVDVAGGHALVGTNHPELRDDRESPLKTKRIRAFRMMETTVTNAMFAEFVDDTGYQTEAERFGWSFVFHHNVSGKIAASEGVQGVEWWRKIDGSFWRMINGPGSDNDWQAEHPVVHVSWNDARAFAAWAGGRLPTEAEWEHAARGGLGDVPFPWGDRDPDDTDFQPCNIWQGRFPDLNTGADGHIATAPARSFMPNGFGLFNMVGNVWEWTGEPFKLRSVSKRLKGHAGNLPNSKLLKGGSFLCHKSYCFRYRIAARTGNTADTSTAHQGFRLVFDESVSGKN